MVHKSKQLFTRCLFLPYSQRENTPLGSHVYDVSSYAEMPFCHFSPMWAHGGIPIPGMSGRTSDSVEGVWQGLKVIRGAISERHFRGKGSKRGGKPSGHRLGSRLLDLVEAREKIYRPTYEWMLEHKIDTTIIDILIERAISGFVQYFHDVGDNGDIGNQDEGWSHAAVLVQWLNRRCEQRVTQR